MLNERKMVSDIRSGSARSWIIGAAVIALAGCAAPVSVSNIVGPDGRTAYVMKCSGMGRDRSSCLARAGELCPTGYTVVDDDSKTGGALVTGNMMMIARRDYLTVSCKS